MRLFRRGEGSSTLDLLVVGLGNPGRKYEHTRHNAGYMVVDELARRHSVSFRSKFSGRVGDLRLSGVRLGLLTPETFMNESGRSVGAALRFYKLRSDQLVIVHDEVDLEPGRIQVRLGGGIAGHRGLRSVMGSIGTGEFVRVRIGVGRPERGDPRPVADYVLSAFPPELDVGGVVSRASDAVETIALEGLDEAQRRFNEWP